MMSVCAVGSGKRRRRDVPAAILASIELKVAFVSAMRTAFGGKLGLAWPCCVEALASPGPAISGAASSTLAAPAMRKGLPTIKEPPGGRWPASFSPLFTSKPPNTLNDHSRANKTWGRPLAGGLGVSQGSTPGPLITAATPTSASESCRLGSGARRGESRREDLVRATGGEVADRPHVGRRASAHRQQLGLHALPGA